MRLQVKSRWLSLLLVAATSLPGIYLQEEASGALPTFQFTNASATGRNGPDQTQVTNAYAATSLAGQVTINTQGVQEWLVPSSGNYQIDIAGAAGGAGLVGSGGNGAYLSVRVSLTSGTRLAIVVGQTGSGYNASNSFPGGSGGGGSFIYKVSDNSYIAVAGGGGGGASSSTNLLTTQTTAHGKYDTTTASSVSITAGYYALGGVSGTGGGRSNRNVYYGGPGAGVNSDGATSNGGQGRSRVNGWIGGGGNGLFPVVGGFGGGGASGSETASSYGWSGGGGGYSGGAAAGNGGSSDGQYGGGGSSYYTGVLLNGSTGTNSGHGYVTFTQLAPPTVGISIAGSVKTVPKGNVVILSATTDNSGKVTFFADGKKIPNCINISASVGTVTCNWKPAVQKVVRVNSSLSINGAVAATSEVISISVTRRTGTR